MIDMIRTIKRFAFWPESIKGKWVWLKYYYIDQTPIKYKISRNKTVIADLTKGWVMYERFSGPTINKNSC